MLPSKNEDNTLQIKEKSTERTTPFFCARSYCTFRRWYFGYPSQFGSPVLPQNPYGYQPSFWTKAISADGVKADVVAVRQEKWLSSAFWNATDGSIPLWWIMPSLKRYSLSSKRKSCRTALFIPIVWAATTSWTWAVLSITASTIPRNLQTARTTSTALRIFGIRQNVSCENTTESIANLSRCSWKNANFGLTSAHRPGSLKSCGIGVEFRANLRQPLLFFR